MSETVAPTVSAPLMWMSDKVEHRKSSKETVATEEKRFKSFPHHSPNSSLSPKLCYLRNKVSSLQKVFFLLRDSTDTEATQATRVCSE